MCGIFRTLVACSTAVIAAAALAYAEPEPGKIVLPEGLNIYPHAYGHFESGQIKNGNIKYDDLDKNGGKYPIDHVWSEDALVSVGLEARYEERLTMKLDIAAKLYFSYPQFFDKDRYTKNLRQDVFIDDAFVKYDAPLSDAVNLSGQMGYFKFKYNPDVRNLGEYLFRSGTYPAFLDNTFDFPQARLLGFHGQGVFFNDLKADLFFISQTVFPAMNWSLAGIVNYDLLGLHALEIGGGIEFAHLIDVYTNHSFPANGGDPTQLRSDVNPQYIKQITSSGDTILDNYTFKGTKVMAKVSFDPKPFIPWKIFGKNDLKIYAEACIIGAKSYPDSAYMQGGIYTLVAPSYNSIRDKTPRVIGINLPTFNYLDVINVECEYAGMRYYNDNSLVINKGSVPLPNGIQAMLTDPNAPKKSNYYWSIYGKKSLCNGHFSIIGQIAHDHMRLSCAQYDLEYWNDLLVTRDDWWWSLKTSWAF